MTYCKLVVSIVCVFIHILHCAVNAPIHTMTTRTPANVTLRVWLIDEDVCAMCGSIEGLEELCQRLGVIA